MAAKIKNYVLVIVGPTASGKSDMAMQLAKKFNGEIICADSRTIYRGMDIGTAKPSKNDRELIPHHLLDVVDPDEKFTVADFKERATRAINDIKARHKLPIMVGGSGLYIDSVLYDFEFSAANSERDEQNPRHLKKDVPKVRKKLSQDTLVIGIKVEREELKSRIEKRIEQMMASGLVDEAKKLYKKYPNSSALLAPGYRAIIEYLNNSVSLNEAKNEFIANDKKLAKRQMTWFNRNADINWVTNYSEAEKLLRNFL